MTIFINGKQKRVRREPTIDGISVDEFIRRNADPIWLHQNEMWEDMQEEPNSFVCYAPFGMWKLITIATVLSGLSAGLQKNSPQQDPVALAAKNAQATINWEQVTSPGMKAEMLLVKKAELKGHLAVTYRLKVTGAPENQRYALTLWPITVPDPVAVMQGLVINPSGLVVCPAHSTDSCAKNFDGAEVKLEFAPVKGEIFRGALISADQRSRIFFSTVPDPIVKKDGSCSLELVRLSPGYELVLVRAKGFPANENVAFHTQSYDEVHDVSVKTNPQGEFWAPLTPFVAGKQNGTTSVVAKNPKCAPALSFNWGTGQ
ncbi:MAG TPA: hypothetical protein VG759_04145 [Candidatus Angelobacter sp.]|nr:hypothetical protein [Candidatus Angelobacter sp.]